jgi:tetratricopeptide (TPR) repeat protein
MRIGIALAALLAALPTAMPAYADNALSPERIPNKARKLAEKGRAAHEAGDYEVAIASFKEAYVLAPSPSLLFNIAQSYRLAGNCDEASWMYRRFLDTNPIGDQRRIAEQHLSTVEKCSTGTLEVTVAAAPKLEAQPPVPKLEVTQRVAPPDERSHRYKKYGVIAGVGGTAVLATAAVFAWQAHVAQTMVSETYKRGGRWEDIADDDARGRRDSTIATILGVGGGLAASTGIALYALGHHYEAAQHVAVVPTGRGAQLSLSWGF